MREDYFVFLSGWGAFAPPIGRPPVLRSPAAHSARAQSPRKVALCAVVNRGCALYQKARKQERGYESEPKDGRPPLAPLPHRCRTIIREGASAHRLPVGRSAPDKCATLRVAQIRRRRATRCSLSAERQSTKKQEPV